MSTFRCRRSPADPFPSHLPKPPLFQAVKVASVHPLPQHAPLCAHPPQGIQAWAHHLISGSLSSRGTASKPKAKRKRDPAAPPARSPGLPHHRTIARAPPHSALPAPRGHLSRRRRGLSAGIGGTYRCGAGAGAASRGRAGPAACRAQVRPGALSPLLAPAPPPAPVLGALSCAACSPPPSPALGLPPRRVAGPASPTPPVLPRGA